MGKNISIVQYDQIVDLVRKRNAVGVVYFNLFEGV